MGLWENFKRTIRTASIKQIDGKTLIGIFLTILITAVMYEYEQNPNFTPLPLWAKIAFYCTMPVLATLFNLENPSIKTLSNKVMDIYKMNLNPVDKLDRIENLIKVMTKEWDITNTKILESFKNGDPMANTVYDILKNAGLNVAQKLTGIRTALQDSLFMGSDDPESETPKKKPTKSSAISSKKPP